MNLFENVSQLDRFEIKTKLIQFSINVPDNEGTEKMKNILKKVLLEEILKTDIDNKSYYSSRLKEVIDYLFLGSNSEKYLCCLAGCRYHGERHRDYVMHIKRCHPNLKTILCNFKKQCKLSFTGIESLLNI